MRQELKDVQLKNLYIYDIRKYGDLRGLCHYEAKVRVENKNFEFVFSNIAFTKEGFIELLRAYMLQKGYDVEDLL